MSDIYEQHRVAFANVRAYVILNGAKERVATIAFKFPKDGAGRLYAYVHYFGAPMVRGFARGSGYDKRSAAVDDACRKLNSDIVPAVFRAALRDGYSSWAQSLEHVGFTVIQAV